MNPLWSSVPLIHPDPNDPESDHPKEVKVKSVYDPRRSSSGAYPRFINRLKVFLLLPRWDTGLSQGYPPALNSLVRIYTPGKREAL